MTFFSGQAVQREDGAYRLRTKEDGGMNALFCKTLLTRMRHSVKKPGNNTVGTRQMHRGIRQKGSIIGDYQYEQNIMADFEFSEDGRKVH